MRKWWLALCLVLLPCLAAAQTLFDTVRPQVMIVVRKHAMGSDLFEIQMLQGGVDLEAMKAALKDFETQLGSPLQVPVIDRRVVPGPGPSTEYLTAKFAVNGFIDRKNKRINLQPLVRAFSSMKANPPVKGFSIVLDGEKPTDETVRQYLADDVGVQAIHTQQPLGIEYRVEVRTTNPSGLVIPSALSEVPAEPKSPPAKPSSTFDWRIAALVGVGLIALGALVYSLLLQPRNSKRSKSA
ncbi:MAG: hypothetical protein JST35_03685 [Armatimonadetes bacterium]|nr:hypothetical protein [Armatimonadota bacterium]